MTHIGEKFTFRLTSKKSRFLGFMGTLALLLGRNAKPLSLE